MSGLFRQLAQREMEIAEKEGRQPRGWIWTEQMDAPRAIDFDALKEEEEDAEPQAPPS